MQVVLSNFNATTLDVLNSIADFFCWGVFCVCATVILFAHKVDISSILFTILVMKSTRAPIQTADEKAHFMQNIELLCERERAKLEKERGKVLKLYSLLLCFHSWAAVLFCSVLLAIRLRPSSHTENQLENCYHCEQIGCHTLTIATYLLFIHGKNVK